MRARPILAASIARGALAGAGGGAQIATAANIDLCLGSVNGSLGLVDCLESEAGDHQWQAWGWDPSKRGAVEGPLCMETSCVGGDLALGEASAESWTWSDRNMKIQHGGRCLTVVEGGVELAECDWTTGDAEGHHPQNGGGPASQTWVLLPKSRPQQDVVSNLRFPLRSSGRYIIDSVGRTVKLVGVNWYGAHMEQLVNNGLDRATVEKIAARIKRMGFNSVRLNYALNVTDDSGGSFPAVPLPRLVAGDPGLAGLNVLEVFDRCVRELTDRGLLVIINVHMNDAGWCCNLEDNNALWYNNVYSEEAWMKSLEFLAARYKDNNHVIGFDIRNEPRTDATTGDVAYWGVWEPGAWLTSPLFRLRDWRVGAAKGAVATWKGNPDALVIVEGINFAMHLKYVESRPLKLKQECLFSRIVYENHDYPFFDFRVWDWLEYPWAWWTIYTDVRGHTSDEVTGEGEGSSGSLTEAAESSISREYDRFKSSRVSSFLFLHTDDRAPVWTGEFGTNDRNSSFWQNLIRLYGDVDYNWCYWPLDAVTVLPGFSNAVVLGESLAPGRNDSYGVFDWQNADYRAVVGWKVQDLISIMGTRPDFPSSLAAPDRCEFSAELNEAYAAEGTSLGEMLASTNWPLWISVWGCLSALCTGVGCALRVGRGACAGLSKKAGELWSSLRGRGPSPEAEPLAQSTTQP